jgi:DNA-binding NtrC family response regulator
LETDPLYNLRAASKRQPTLALLQLTEQPGEIRRYVSRIFVVDDEPLICSTLATILNLHGYAARSFIYPLDALAAARSNAPDLLISDVMMPGVSGIELAIQMTARHPECKILLFSGQSATYDLLEDARSRGHNFPLLEKPVPPSVMLSRVAALVVGGHAARIVKSMQ